MNDSADELPLRYAESDARAIWRTFTGALGPAQATDGALLLGAAATRKSVLRCLQAVAELPTDYLFFYFSGHGSQEGIALADGLLDHRLLRYALGQIDCHATLIALDTCHAGAYAIGGMGVIEDVSGLEDSWADVLASATPGTRMFFATRPDELSSEGGDLAGGHFTWALLQAMHRARGTIQVRDQRFVSDLEVFNLASRILLRRWPADAHPSSRKLRGDFPMLLSQADAPVGDGTVWLSPLARGVASDIGVQAAGRRGVPLSLACRLYDTDGDLLGEKQVHFLPRRDDDSYTTRIVLPLDAATQGALRCGYELPVRWEVELVDPYHGHVISRATKRMRYFWNNR
ncbi:caspase family protein [Sorangium sp. So ce1151]|uniref:caspase family protein n=1 Tax=Sorangium sp. So ce1151 TaxID=3133332 RepID=UPI003F5F908B